MHFVPHTEHFISPTEKSFAFCVNLWGLPIIKHAKGQSDECYVGLNLFAALEKKNRPSIKIWDNLISV